MTITSNENPNIIKRAISVTLALLLLMSNISLFNVKAINLKCLYCTSDPCDCLFTIFLENLSNEIGLTDGLSRINARLFKRKVEETYSSQAPVGTFPRLEGGRLLYEYHGYNTIKIGEYVFNRYHFGTPVNMVSEVLRYESYFRYNADFPPNGFRPVQLYYIPFFIHDGDLYFETTGGATNFPHNNTYHSFYPGSLANIHGSVLNAGIQFNPNSHIALIINQEHNFSTSTTSIFWSNNREFISHHGNSASNINNRAWRNVSQYVRNARDGRTTPGLGTRFTLEQITGGDYSGIHNFSPNDKGSGVVIIPPLPFMTTGMTLWEYFETLDPDTLYELQPPELTEREIDLPEIIRTVLENLEDGDEVEIVVCPDTGEISFRVIKGGGSDDSGGNNGGSLIGSVAIVAQLERILQELKKITENTSRIANSSSGDSDGGADLDNECCCDHMGIFQQILVELRTIASNIYGSNGMLVSIFDRMGEILEAINNVSFDLKTFQFSFDRHYGDESGTTIFDVLKTLIDLPSRIAEAIANIFNSLEFGGVLRDIIGLIEPILDFINDFGRFIIDTAVYLIIPSDRFFDDTLGGFIERVEAKIPIVKQAESLYTGFIGILENSSSEPPVININGEMFGAEINSTINMDIFDDYISWIHGVILVTAYIPFIRSVIKRVPKLLGGIGCAD